MLSRPFKGMVTLTAIDTLPFLKKIDVLISNYRNFQCYVILSFLFSTSNTRHACKILTN